MKAIRFIHTADIHLGSLLHITGDMPENLDKLVTRATYDAFSRICGKAMENDVNFVVVSGDLYDRESRSVKASQYFAEQCEKLFEKNIPVYVIAGNHDPLVENANVVEMPPNVYMIGSSNPESFVVQSSEGHPVARIIGQSYYSKSETRKLHVHYKSDDCDIWNIGLLHTQLNPHDRSYIPCTATELINNKDIHYWALGHIHKHCVINAEIPVIAYPGIPQGRDFGELEQGGCLLVDMSPFDEPSIEFLPTSPVIWKEMVLDMDKDPEEVPANINELKEAMQSKYEEFMEVCENEIKDFSSVKGFIVRWVIRGRGPLHHTLNENDGEALELLMLSLRDRYSNTEPFLWTESVKARTQKQIPYELLKESNPVFDEIDRTVSECLEDDELKLELAKSLGQIWENDADFEDAREDRFHMDDITYRDVIERAKRLVVDRLTGEGDAL